MAAFCSWNLLPSLSEAFRDLSTHRMTQFSSLEPSDFELKSLMQQNAVLVLDVRNADEFKSGHIPGAVNLNYTRVTADGGRFKGESRAIVAYCACANEMTAARAAVDLAALGIPGAKALQGGWDEWLARGEKVEK